MDFIPSSIPAELDASWLIPVLVSSYVLCILVARTFDLRLADMAGSGEGCSGSFKMLSSEMGILDCCALFCLDCFLVGIRYTRLLENEFYVRE